MIVLDYHYDDGRGWLAVDGGILSHIGIKPTDFRGDSVERAGLMYLDDRNDMAVVLEAMEASHMEYELDRIYDGMRSNIRDFDRIKGAR